MIAGGLSAVLDEVAAAATRAGRDPHEVGLVAVSKRHSAGAIETAARAGQRVFGESYAQELATKAPQVKEPVEWHFIGTLQRNKVKLVVGVASLIHAVDSERLALSLDQRAAGLEIVQPVLIEVNVGGEVQKGGVLPAATESLVTIIRDLPHLRLDGLMTMPPFADQPEINRPHFRALRTLRDRMATPASPLPVLSMGTSADYAVAVEEGATLIRVGTAIFGSREAPL